MKEEQISDIEELQCLDGIMRRRIIRPKQISASEKAFLKECENELLTKLVKREIQILEEKPGFYSLTFTIDDGDMKIFESIDKCEINFQEVLLYRGYDLVYNSSLKVIKSIKIIPLNIVPLKC